MRIGLTTFFKGSAFGGPLPQVALYMAKGLKAAGHEVDFIIPADSADWFTDCLGLQSEYKVSRLINGSQIRTFNLIVEVVWYLPVGMRRQLAEKTVMFYHYPPVFYDIENSVYPVATQIRNFEGLTAVWTWSHFAATDLAYLELLSRLPVLTVPFVWDSCLLDMYCREASVPPAQTTVGRDTTAVICESNESNTSHCILPLTIVSEIHKARVNAGAGPQKWVVLNSDTVAGREYFKQNIIGNLHIGTDCSGNFIKRLRLPDLCREPNVLVTHQRFRPIKYMLLDALYLGLPLIHNCDMLTGIPGAEFHYTLNRIGQAVDCWNRITSVDRVALSATRGALVSRWGVGVFAASVGPLLQKTWVITVPQLLKQHRIAFFDMWANFVPQHNLFMALVGDQMVLDQNNPTLIVFGPFGKENLNPRWADLPKIFYTGENLPPIKRRDVVLNIGFKRDQTEGYLRLPNWMLELNWMNQDPKLICNPHPFSLEMLPRPGPMPTRSKFCAFVASNPACVQRNTAYHTLCRYKPVDSAGSLYNNCTRIEGGPGGTGGQSAKVEFYKQYRFALVCENSTDPGYVTEKLVHARLAGCVPIYWGDSRLEEDFNTAGIIQISNYPTAERLLEMIKRIDESHTMWSAMASHPLFNEDGLDRCRSLLKRLGEAVISAATQRIIPETPKIIAPPVLVPATPVPATPVPATPVPATPVPATLVPATPVPATSVMSSKLRVINVKIGSYGLYRQTYIGDVSGNRAIITCCNKDYVEAAIRLIKSTTLPVYVWIWDITTEKLALLEAAQPAAIIPFDMSWNPNWPDFWNPLHYAWKLLLWVLVPITFAKGTQILYLDSGVSVCSSLDRIWASVADTGLFVVEMPEHKNRTWSHATFCSLMKMTHEELEAPQYSSNIVGFEAGGRWSRLFEACFSAACNKEIVVGHKWYQYSAECFGHRHDQSIISLLGRRLGAKPHNLYDFVSHVSSHDGLYRGLPFYVHRRLWKTFRQFADGTDEVFVVNLAHRNDRMERFWTTHPYMKALCYREEAVYGNKLTMTPELAHLFRDNDFKWKKGVIGCALSHYNIWKRLAADPVVSSYLVLEDDVVLTNKFLETWQTMGPLMPDDADIIFLGGVLPPNRSALPHLTEQVNSAFARVKRHAMMGGGVPRRYFHFCTYSYIITKRGAKKLLDLIAQRGIFTSIDHMLVNHGDVLLNIYFTTPLLAGCFQDNDPAYQKANFNDFNRVDTFDSEIWNNKECFTAAEIAAAVAPVAVAPVAAAPVAAAPVAVAPVAVAPVAAATPVPLPIIYFESHQPTEAIDSEWLAEIFQRPFKWIYAGDAATIPAAGETLLVYYQHTTPVVLIEGWINRHMDRKIHLLHASDERLIASTTLYAHPGIKTVFRNYWRPDCVGPKVVHLPLGYLNGKGMRSRATTSSSTRKHVWSFAGAIDRPDRGPILEAMRVDVPNHLVHITPTWKSTLNLDAKMYREVIQNSQFVPCLSGIWNIESYRFYEAIENGAIPMITIDKMDSYKNLLSASVNPPLIATDTWKAAAQVMNTLSSQPILLDKIQKELGDWWSGYKDYLMTVIKARLSS